MTSANSEINFKIQKSIKTKNNLILFANIAILTCFVLDFFKYQSTYSNLQFYFQLSGISISAFAILFYFTKGGKFTSASFLISSYNAITNIIITSIVFPFTQLKMFYINEAFVTRDVLLLFSIITVVGFVSSKIHLLVQSLMLIGFILYEAFFSGNTFIGEQAPVYLIAIIGVCLILYFMFDFSKTLIYDLNETNGKLAGFQKLNHKKLDKLEAFYEAAINIDKPTKNKFKKHIFSNNALNNIAENVSETLNCNRVSVWSFNNGKNILHKKVLLENKFFEYENMELNVKQFPFYFHVILSGGVFKVPDVNNSEAIKEFSDLYLQKNKIKSVLSYPLKYNNEVIGVLCCENQTEINNWEEEEIKFIELVSVIASLHLINENAKNKISNKETLSTNVTSN